MSIITMKTVIPYFLNLFITLLALSCSDDNVIGRIGLSDPDGPEVKLISSSDHITILDTTTSFRLQANAYDFFGIQQVCIMVNGKTAIPWQNTPVTSITLSGSILVDTSMYGKDNIVYALASDVSNNTTKSSPITLTVQQTFFHSSNWNKITIPDRGSISSILLDSVFVDTLSHATPIYQLLSNSNSKLVDAKVIGNVLSLKPRPYSTGKSIISLKAINGKLILTKTFEVQVTLSNPFQKVFMPDSCLRNILRDQYGFTDLNDNYIVKEQADTLQYLLMDFPPKVNSFIGIESFTSLIMAHLIGNYKVNGVVNLSNCSRLRFLVTDYIEYKDLLIDNLTTLETLNLNYCFIDNLYLPKLTQLQRLIIGGGVNYIDLSQNRNLTDLRLFLYRNNSTISTINLSENTFLQTLYINNSNLSTLDLSRNINLKTINILYNNNLTATYVWTLPLPGDVEVKKDVINTLYKK